MQAIEARGLTRAYYGVEVVRGVDLEVGTGQIAVVEGPNGAGKTTLWAMLAGIVTPTSGTVRLLNRAVDPNDTELKRQLGIVPDHSMMFESLTGEELLLSYARIYGLSREKAAEQVEWALGHFKLHGVAKRPIMAWSTGQRKRIRIASAILHGPRVLLLDDPFDGMDQDSVLIAVSVLRALTEDGATIFLTARETAPELLGLNRRLYPMVDGQLLSPFEVGEPAWLRSIARRWFS